MNKRFASLFHFHRGGTGPRDRLQQLRLPGWRAGHRDVAVLRPVRVDDSFTKLTDHLLRGPRRNRGGRAPCHPDQPVVRPRLAGGKCAGHRGEAEGRSEGSAGCRCGQGLDANSVALADARIGLPRSRETVPGSWRQHIGFFVDYTLGKATKNDKQVAKAKADLDAYRTSFGELINLQFQSCPPMPSARN